MNYNEQQQQQQRHYMMQQQQQQQRMAMQNRSMGNPQMQMRGQYVNQQQPMGQQPMGQQPMGQQPMGQQHMNRPMFQPGHQPPQNFGAPGPGMQHAMHPQTLRANIESMPLDIRQRFDMEMDQQKKKIIYQEFIKQRYDQQQQIMGNNMSMDMHHRMQLEQQQRGSQQHPQGMHPQMQRTPSQSSFQQNQMPSAQMQYSQSNMGPQMYQMRPMPPQQQPQFAQNQSQFSSDHQMNSADIKPVISQQNTMDFKPSPAQMLSNQAQPSPQVLRPGSVKPATIQASPQYPTNNPPSTQMPSSHPSMLQQAQTPQQLQQPMSHGAQLKQSPMPPHSVGHPQSVGPKAEEPLSTGAAIAQPRSMRSNYANSPQINAPGSAQNASAQRSLTPQNVQAQPDVSSPDFERAFAELKSYRAKAIQLLDRVRAEGHENLERSVSRVVEVMDGKREADLRLLDKLLSNLTKALKAHDPVRSMDELSGRVTTLPRSFDICRLPERADCVAKYKIHLPNSVANLLSKRAMDKSRKRPFPDDQKDVPVVVKKAGIIRFEDTVAGTELKEKFDYSKDPDFLRVSEHVKYSFVLVAFKPKGMDKLEYSVPPLRLFVPHEYPDTMVQICQQSPTRGEIVTPLQFRIMESLKKNMTNDKVLHSITDLIHLWRRTVVQLIVPPSDIETRKLILKN